MSNIFKLDFGDLGRGLVVAILTAVLSFATQLIQAKGLAITSVDLTEIISVAVLAALGYLAKNLLSDKQGKFLGKI